METPIEERAQRELDAMGIALDAATAELAQMKIERDRHRAAHADLLGIVAEFTSMLPAIEQAVDLKSLAEMLNGGVWLFGASKESGEGDVVGMFRTLYQRSVGAGGPVHIVHSPSPTVPGESMILAITGNGAESEARAKYMAWAQPANMIAMMSAIIDLLTRTAGDVQAYRSKIWDEIIQRPITKVSVRLSEVEPLS